MEHGIEGLNYRPKSYTGDFKIYVVEYRHKTGMSLRKTAAYFNIPKSYTHGSKDNIPCRNSITEWERIYREQGKDALYINRRGRATALKVKKQRKTKKNITQNEALLEELQRLRMENEYLKNWMP